MREKQPKPKKPAVTRLAKLETWNPSTQTQRVVKTRQLAYTGDVEALINAVAKLGPAQLAIVRVTLLIDPELDNRVLELGYGTNPTTGVATTVKVRVEPLDLPHVAAYLFAKTDPQIVLAHFNMADGGDGDELPVPKVSVAALAEMPTAAPVQ